MMETSVDPPVDQQRSTNIPPPPSETDHKDLPPMDKSVRDPQIASKGNEHSMTLSTKMSTDQLICKSPQHSANGSVASLKKRKMLTPNRILMSLGILQFVFGFLMVLFGVYVIAYRASLSYLGAGVWGGILSMITGISGTLAAAKHFCPFNNTAQKFAHTTFLALSLISIAVSQLVVVIASTGLARDVNSVEFQEAMGKVEFHKMSMFQKVTGEISQNYRGILFNVALIIVSSVECIVAAIASYRSSRELCPCFRKNEDYYQDNLNMHRSQALVSSWLMEKHGASHAPQIYVVTGPPSSLGRGSNISNVMPMSLYALPAPMLQQQMMGYPLIPAPLGSVPSPIIPPPNRKLIKMSKHDKPKSRSKSKSRSREPTPKRSSRSKSKSKNRETQMTDEEVVKTYTGLDRAMAEEFIDICEMKHASLCSDISCIDSTCQSPCSSSAEGCHTNSDANSQDYLVNK
ncbi:uncharacterized protein LOC109538285 [Dendroctonus ponderosae]|uniref:MARVEL domain-containing protein n=1 Tax=Dendroctonus ponderosae TaxID=77166 RepID=A0AAR5PIZ4_DENPD|nr:uncharacterized protein LOC109538285 [Dendroctonus ponderosae]KAH1015892.1 hypothetical protein HUJ04_007207 [Dendroctonus ponderosae]KAH1015893.1 hypothetical protein HUJ04_007207 [Dendroctonus ponderosae]KAH1015894.1 hypothetical protein HUJ04_007207 [Dendroctonus ponderosae]KAH1025181.1 hypothetical protein HUJ05_009958 [Dendroctonus ponderosae]KAH1025182.1 hypothetical protein HUJ05_009958 [Dendroctonus ponderosae]